MIKKGDRVAVMTSFGHLVKGEYTHSEKGFSFIKTQDHIHNELYFTSNRLKPIIRVYGY